MDHQFPLIVVIDLVRVVRPVINFRMVSLASHLWIMVCTERIRRTGSCTIWSKETRVKRDPGQGPYIKETRETLILSVVVIIILHLYSAT